MATVSHYNIRRVVDIYGAVQDRDLGSVGREVSRIVEASRKLLPRGASSPCRGQIETMRTAYIGLLAGLGFAIVPRLPADRGELPVLARSSSSSPRAGRAGPDRGVLFLTGTTLSVPALMGAS